MSAIRNFLVDPIRYRSTALAKFRWAQWLHVRTKGRFDALYQRWSAVVRPPLSLPAPRRMDATGIAQTVSALKQDGCKVLPFALSTAELDALQTFAFSMPAYSADLSERIEVRADKIPSERGRYYWPMFELVKCPAVKDLLSDSTFTAIAQTYLGARPILAHVTLWLDPVYGGYYDPHVYHFDNDGPGFLKFFFYITDVTNTSGAHRYIKGSHGRAKPQALQASIRYEDEALMKHYGADKEVVFAAPAGTIIAEDTAGFHRGSTPQTNHRLLMQFQFSLIDIPHDEDLAGLTHPVPFAGLDASMAHIQRKFYRA